MLKAKEATKAQREAHVREVGYPAYTTSVGWLGYSDEKVRKLTLDSLQQGFNHFKVSPVFLECFPSAPSVRADGV
jgi:L-fuconate dehydratase